MKKLSYKEKFVQMNKEARAICWLSVVLIIFWWIAAFGTAKIDYTILSMPGWFVVSCMGTYLLAVILVWLVVKKVFVDFDLDDEVAEEASKGDNGK